MQNWQNFNRLASQGNNNSGGGGDKKWDPWEMDNLQFVPDETFYIRVLPPQDGGPYQYGYHWPPGGRKYTCTRDLPGFNGKCVFCETFSGKGVQGRRQERMVLEVVDFRYFHITPHPTKDNRETITRCEHDDPQPRNNRCALCASGNERVAQRHGPRHKVLELNQSQWKAVVSTHGKLQNYCIAVNDAGHVCGKKTYLTALTCVQCQHPAADFDQLRTLSDIQVAQITNSKQTCKSCSHHDFLWQVYACDGGGVSRLGPDTNDTPNGASHRTVCGSMCDKVLEVTVVPEKKKIGNKDVTLKHLNFSTGAGWSTLEDDLKEFGLSAEDIEKIAEPMDLDRFYQPMRQVKVKDHDTTESWVAAVLAAQAEACGSSNPFGDGPSGGPSGPWGNRGLRSFGS